MLPALLILAADQLSKAAARFLLEPGQSVPMIPGIFHFTLVLNKGAAFGIFKNQLVFLIAVSTVAITLIMREIMLQKRAAPFLQRLSLNMILAGAVGNLIDRVFFRYVTDFLDFRVWPVFNIADSAITCGAALLVFMTLRESVIQKRSKV